MTETTQASWPKNTDVAGPNTGQDRQYAVLSLATSIGFYLGAILLFMRPPTPTWVGIVGFLLWGVSLPLTILAVLPTSAIRATGVRALCFALLVPAIVVAWVGALYMGGLFLQAVSRLE